MLAQFPISFKNTSENREYLRKLSAMFRDYPLAVEVRHATWNEPGVLEEFTSLAVGFVNLDQPLIGRAIHATTHFTSPIRYVRLHGRNYKEWFQAERSEDRYNYLYTVTRLEPWQEKIKEISRQTDRTFVIANNHYKGKAAADATELKSMLSGKKVKAPSRLVETYSELDNFAES